MNVIIRLQNLPWSANALDIRKFFKGLSIPDGGVHIVGGEMGDAFIAFSTDEDARQAMMHDREAINGVQVRLLLSSRAEMQKVIETARQQSLRALQNSNLVPAAPTVKVKQPAISQKSGAVTQPQPPVITTNSLQCILSSSITAVTPSFLAYQQQAGISLITPSTSGKPLVEHDSSISRERKSRSRSRSHSRERTSFRRHRERSRESSKERVRALLSQSRSQSRSRSRSNSRERARDRINDRSRTSHRANQRTSFDADTKSQDASKVSSWGSPISVYSSSSIYKPLHTMDNRSNSRNSEDNIQVAEDMTEKSKSSLTSINNYSLSSLLSRSNNNKSFALQNPYTAALSTASNSNHPNTLTTTSSSAIPGIFVEKKSTDIAESTENTLSQEAIVFADTNPYEKMYPNLFAQAATIGAIGQKNIQSRNSQSSPVSPRDDDPNVRESDPPKTRCIKIMNMCPGTTYSDIRKFCVGLYIPHNGIKMVNDSNGLRVGVAYVQFSKYTCVSRALSRNNQLLRNRSIAIEAVSEEEFESITDSFHPDNRDRPHSGNRGDYHSETVDNYGASSNPFKHRTNSEPFSVLYIEDIPTLTTEQDIMKMFSSYSLYDILLLSSPENRREFVAHVRFSREEDAMSAYEDRAHHQIGYRRLRVRPGSLEEMERAKEKIRLANEQLMKEEQAAAEEEERRRKKEEATKSKSKEIISLDLTQSDGEEDFDDAANDVEDADMDGPDFIGDTNKLIENVVNIQEDDANYYNSSRYDTYKDHQGLIPKDNDDESHGYNNEIPSLFDFETGKLKPGVRINDPRLRKAQRGVGNAIGKSMAAGDNFVQNINENQPVMQPMSNNTEQNFVILKNCDYNTRINDVAQLLITANLALKHIEPLRNERQLPTGEFIVEFRRTQDAEIAVNRFHNIQFMNRSLRVFPITPQEIANRLCKPFLGYIPGGNGIKISDLKTLAAAMNAGNNNVMNNSAQEWNSRNNANIFGRNMVNTTNNRFDANEANFSNNSNCSMNEDNDNNGLPERFSRPGCVLELENVPYKAQLQDILNFFHGFDLTSEDVIRRFNDNGQPTGDARVAFDTPEAARKAFDARKRKQIFNRTIYMNIL
uniref:RRM domain-containing protein n=1 Tax=Stomoxys calcitrans TaxID=35570 RepID=A0A1I8Q9E2_STOCA